MCTVQYMKCWVLCHRGLTRTALQHVYHAAIRSQSLSASGFRKWGLGITVTISFIVKQHCKSAGVIKQ